MKRIQFEVALLFIAALISVSGCGSSSGMGSATATVTTTTLATSDAVASIMVIADNPNLYADGVSTTSIRAILRNSSGVTISKPTTVQFSTTGGTLSAATAKTDQGVATVILTSENKVGTATVVAAAGGVSGDTDRSGTPIKFIPVPKGFSLSLSQIAVKSDNSDSSTITATVLDSNNVPIQDVRVNFEVTGGQISSATAVTDERGKASVVFSCGTVEKANKTVSVKATVAGLPSQVIPIQILGTKVELSTERTTLEIGGENVSQLTISLKDAGGQPIFNAPVVIRVEPEGAVLWPLSPGYQDYSTDVVGILKVNITGNKVTDKATVIVESMGAKATQDFSIGSYGAAFRISAPEKDVNGYAGMTTNDKLTITVIAPTQQTVRFSTTFGYWNDDTQSKTVDVRVTNGKASAVLMSKEPGISTVQAYDVDKPSTSDILKVAISAPVDKAKKLSLQASSTIVGLSLGDTKNTVTLKATVKTDTDQVVGGAPVAFALEQTTGGGEFISPVVAYTNYSGVATSIFTSGSLSSGATGVIIKATLLGKPDITSQIKIVIGGTAGSVIIGGSTELIKPVNGTSYRRSMSVLVVDSNGNAVPNAQVSLSLWPSAYAQGYWVSCSTGCCPFYVNWKPNEDINRNLILDPGEDENLNKELTPPASAAGAIVIETSSGTQTTGATGIVTTGSNGVGNFYIDYLKSQAAWIEDEVIATTLVMGSETRSTYNFVLPYEKQDAQECLLSDSPYNTQSAVGEIVVTADPNVLLADGRSESTITAWVTTISGNPVADDTRVNFAITKGTGGLPYNTSTWGYTTSGIVIVPYKASKTVGEVVITASAMGAKDGSVKLTLTNGTISVISDKEKLMADGKSESIISATILDMDGFPIADGERVNFTIEGEGTFSWGSKTYWSTTSGGVATATFKSSTTPGTTRITASSVSLGISANVTVTLSRGEVKLAAEKTRLLADGASETNVTATVLDMDGNPLDNERVNFSLTGGGGLPYATSTLAYTTAGIASVTYRAGSSPGKTIITASTANGSSATLEIELANGKLQLVASPTILTSDGTSQSTITATVTDMNDKPVVDNTRVVFQIMSGGGSFYYSTSGSTSDWEYTAGGIASVKYFAPKTTGTATITATAQDIGASNTVTITLKKGKITLGASPSTLIADGESQSTITAYLTDAQDEPVSSTSIRVTFQINGEGGFGYSKTYSTYTTGDRATATYTVGGTPGTATITATAEGYETGTYTLTLDPEGVGFIRLNNPTSVPADGKSSTSITATITDSGGNPISKGTKVQFQTTLGTFSNGQQKLLTETPNETGVITVPLISSPTEGFAEVTCIVGITGCTDPTDLTTCSIKLSQKTQVEFTGRPRVGAISLASNVASMPINGAKAILTATLTAAQGETQALDGIPVKFSITGTGSGSWQNDNDPATPKETTVSSIKGLATATLLSGTTAGTVTIRAELENGLFAETQIQYTPGGLTLEITPATILGTGKETSQLKAILKDASGVVVPNATVSFSLSDMSMGQIAPTSATTDAKGEAKATFTGYTKGGTVTVTAKWTTAGVDVTGVGTITINPPPAFIRMVTSTTENPNPNPSEIAIKGTGGQSTSQIVFEVIDAQGNPVEDGYRIEFTILTGPNGGEEVSPPFAVTTTTGTGTSAVKGRVSTILSSGFKSGPVSIKASYANDRNISTTSSQIAIAAGQPVGEEFGISIKYRNISGLRIMGLKDPITVSAGDIWGNAVPDNTVISFKTYNTGGLIDPGSAPTKDGIATSTLISTNAPVPQQGFMVVTAEAVNGGRTTHITSLAIYSETPDNSILFAGTDGGGVYKSTDSGTTWRNVSASSDIAGQNFIDPYVNAVAVDPDNPDVVYAATGYLGEGHLYRSLDGGLNWNSNYEEEWNGVFSSGSAVLSVLCDDDGIESSRYVWIGTEGIGTEGTGLYYSSDGKVFKPSDLKAAATIRSIVKVPGTHEATARLYAGTATGVYKSINGGKNWTKVSSFIGNAINSLAIHPSSNPFNEGTDILYAGTKDAGVFVSTDSGSSWTAYTSGLGKGLSATLPKINDKNVGTGTMSKVTVLKNAVSENWTVKCKTKATNGGTFSVTGSVSGAQADYNITSGKYTIPNVLEFTITDGFVDFEVNDTFTFSTTRDPGRNIKNLLVDDTNDKLYALTYFNGPLEPHPVGNVYVHDLNKDGSMKTGDWREANTGLPQYDPPDDTTLFGQHALALLKDVFPPYNTTALFIGGEGINFYKAVSGLSTGNPSWTQSKSGLTNRIMVRMPVLFSGDCTMDVRVIEMKTREVTVGTVTTIYYDYTFDVYIQDSFGNPPISGGNFTATQYGASTIVLRSIDYGDVYIYSGTYYREPSDPATNIPYRINGTINTSLSNSKIEFVYDPKCTTDTDSRGCSGSKQIITY